MSSKRKAEKAALAQCRATGGGSCKIMSTYHNGCGVIAWGDKSLSTAHDYISLTSIYAGSSRGKPSLVYQDLDGLRSIAATDADLNKLHSMIASVITDGIGNKEKVRTGLHESCAVFFSGSIRDGRFYALSSNELENEAMPASAAYKFMQSLVEREME